MKHEMCMYIAKIEQGLHIFTMAMLDRCYRVYTHIYSFHDTIKHGRFMTN